LEAETVIIPEMEYSREEFIKKCCEYLLATAESLFGHWHFPHSTPNALLQRNFSQKSNMFKTVRQM